MAALWRLDQGTVEDVRGELPARYRGAYTTVQTVLNRLAERGLVARQRPGRGYVYRPALTEVQYLYGTIRQALAGASSGARQAALANIIGAMRPEELAELQARAGAGAASRSKPVL